MAALAVVAHLGSSLLGHQEVRSRDLATIPETAHQSQALVVVEVAAAIGLDSRQEVEVVGESYLMLGQEGSCDVEVVWQAECDFAAVQACTLWLSDDSRETDACRHIHVLEIAILTCCADVDS